MGHDILPPGVTFQQAADDLIMETEHYLGKLPLFRDRLKKIGRAALIGFVDYGACMYGFKRLNSPVSKPDDPMPQ